jgi:outer membrane receptor protein involved in Fe transport
MAKLKTNARVRATTGTRVGLALAALAGPGLASADAATAEAPRPAAGAPEEIVVTARRREETLTSVPVVVSALSAQDIARYKADDLTKIGELTPTVIIGAYKSNGGGSIAIRGISSPANQTGFEQAVSVAIDGVQTSDGRIAQLGFFDVRQVEVMKGPQALFFGKNSPAGVISVATADPTDEFEVSAKAAYEFEGDEATIEAAVSGPLGENFGGRLAVRYRNLDGWLTNTARPIANPFYNAATGAPAGAAQLPGAAVRRPGDEDLLGRLTLEGEFSERVDTKLKVFHGRTKGDGPGVASQNIGPCPTGVPRMYGVADPNADCKADDRTTVGDVPLAIAQTIRGVSTNGVPEDELTATMGSFDVDVNFDAVTLSLTTGYSKTDYRWFGGFDQTTYSQLAFANVTTNREFSQEVRLSSDLSGPLNWMAGAFYQDTALSLYDDVKLNDGSYSAAANRYVTYEDLGTQDGRTTSAFGQLMYRITDTVELAGGLRWTSEKKDFRKTNLYGIGAFDTTTTAFPGSDELGYLKGRFEDDNVSPEATLTWRPSYRQTVFVAYKTGFKSGGFGLTTPLQRTTRLEAVDFESEKAKGFEIGAKGMFLDDRLRANVAVFNYRFENLQVNSYNPTLVAFTINNAGAVKQRGIEADVNFQATELLTLRAAAAYVHARFEDFTGQCYGYTFATGTTRPTAVPPPNCEFLNSTALTLQQRYDGRAPARSPDVAGNAGFTLDVPVGGAYKLGVTGDAFYSDSYYAAETMAPTTLQDSFWRLNASVSFGAADDRWSVALMGRNLTDEHYLLYAADRTGGTSVPGTIGEQRGVVSRGRELTLTGSVRF